MIKTLEQHRSFPFIAWLAIAGLCLMTIALSIQLNSEMTALASDREYTETILKEGFK